MKALGGSYLKVSVCRLRQKEKERVAFALNRHEFGFLVHRKLVGDGLLLFSTNCLSSINSPASSAQTNFGSEEFHTVNSDQPKTVRVRFKLHKQCAFGQEFLVVGDDPNLGLWDPSDGVPLNWSEGHVWTADVDMLCSKMINYKFILKEITGAVSWQPGPDRILETWDTAKTISVSEDWDSPDFQNIELLAVDDLNKPSFNDSGLWAAKNLNQIGVEERNDDANDSGLLVAENLNQREEGEGSDVMEEQVDANEHTSEHSDKTSTLNVVESVTEEFGELDSSMSGRGSGLLSEGREETTWGDNSRVVINGSNSSSLKNKMRLVMDEGVPVLVPGLSTMPLEEVVEAEEVKPEVNIMVRNTSVVSDEIVEVTTVNGEIEESTDLIQEKNNIIVEVKKTTVIDKIEDSTDLIQEKSNIILEVTKTTVKDEIDDSTDLMQEKNNIIVEDTTTESDELEAAATKSEIRVSASLHCAETREVMAGEEEKPQLNGDKEMEIKILEMNMQWGRRTIQKILANILGFMQHS